MGLQEMSILEKGFAKVEYMENALNDFPHITRDGRWLTHANGHWTGGFWVGLLWMKSLYSSNPYKAKANTLQWAKRLKVRTGDNKTHDQGFIFGPSCIFGYNIAKELELIEMAAAGARNMKDLYERRTGLVLAWDEPDYEGIAIVDTIMNLPLLVWTAERMNQPEYMEIACNVANNILKNHVRQDYSIYHKVRWDVNSFQIIERSSHQGYSAETCWSRGQAWALYGFANMYRYTHDRLFLQASEKLAEYFWGNVDDDVKLSRWDFIFKNNSEQPVDAAATSIAASGMLLLSDLFERGGEENNSRVWAERGKVLIDALKEHCLYSEISRYGIIEKATVDKPRNSGIGESTMYGDYYFMEAVYRLMNINNKKMLDLLY